MKTLLLSILLYACAFSSVIPIQKGWNLVGGVDNGDLNISKYRIVWTYNGGEWKNSIEDTLNIDKSKGVWVLSTDDATENLEVSEPIFEDLELNIGWNLVGGLSNRFEIYNLDIARVFEYTPTKWVIDPDNETLDINKGYWIYSYTKQTISIETTSLTPPSIDLEGNTNDNNFSFTDEDYAALDRVSRIKALDKIFTTFYLGLKKEDIEKYVDDNASISKIKDLLNSSNPSQLYSVEDSLDYYSFYNNIVAQKALARLYEMEISSEYVNLWVAYNLVNSKFFSASTSLDTVDDTTGVNLYQKIFADIQMGKSTSDILFSYLNSEEHWRRFRSPEDNTRETLELQISVFDDSLVPLASQTCKNYRYDESEKNLVVDFNYNFTPVTILDESIVSCESFYELVANDSRVTSTFVDYFLNFYFPTYDETQKYAIKSDILALNPRSYKEILLSIVFSNEYIKNSVKPKTLEELYLSNAKKMDFIPSYNTFRDFSSIAKDANQPIMYYKLGRELTAPTDILSATIIIKNFRNKILLDSKDGMYNDWDAGWSYDFVESLNWESKESFLEDIFIYMLQREVEASEKEAFLEMFSDYGVSKQSHKQTMLKVVLDYISQIPEIYVTNSL